MFSPLCRGPNARAWRNETYKNTFKLFGDPCPAEADSERDYARRILKRLYPRKEIHGVKCAEVSSEIRRGLREQIQWQKDVREAAVEWTAEHVPNLQVSEDAAAYLPIRDLLDRLEEAVEETQPILIQKINSAKSLDELLERLERDGEEWYELVDGVYAGVPNWGKETETVNGLIYNGQDEGDIVSGDTRGRNKHKHRYLMRDTDAGTNHFLIKTHEEMTS